MTIATQVKLGAPPPITYQDVLARDSLPTPEIFGSSPLDLGNKPTPASRYTCPKFFQSEVEKVFFRTWQFVCHEDEISASGDTLVYDLLGVSVLVVRQPDGDIRAFKNICRHRGRKLVSASGCRSEFRCAYHGITWNTDGTLRENPFAWDFTAVRPDQFGLLTVRVATWAGLVFINFDESAAPLVEQLAPMPEHFKRWRMEECYKSAHVAKVMPANWKVCAEAFIESHHVLATHPQFDAFTGHDYSQIDILSDHVTRFLTATGLTPSTYRKPIDDARLFALMVGSNARGAQGATAPSLPAGMTTRAFAAQAARKTLGDRLGLDLSDISDAEMLDGIAYDFFPNFHLWGGFKDKISYRFRPIDHDHTLLEVMLFAITPKGEAKPRPAKFRLLAGDERWSSAPELGSLGGVYEQDESNMGPVQEGLRALGEGEVYFSAYLEARCRNLHRMVDQYLAK